MEGENRFARKSMNAKRFFLCCSVAACVAFTACSKKDDREAAAASRSASVAIHSPGDLVAEQIRTRIEAVCVGTELRLCGDPVYASEALPGFHRPFVHIDVRQGRKARW